MFFEDLAIPELQPPDGAYRNLPISKQNWRNFRSPAVGLRLRANMVLSDENSVTAPHGGRVADVRVVANTVIRFT